MLLAADHSRRVPLDVLDVLLLTHKPIRQLPALCLSQSVSQSVSLSLSLYLSLNPPSASGSTVASQLFGCSLQRAREVEGLVTCCLSLALRLLSWRAASCQLSLWLDAESKRRASWSSSACSSVALCIVPAGRWHDAESTARDRPRMRARRI